VQAPGQAQVKPRASVRKAFLRTTRASSRRWPGWQRRVVSSVRAVARFQPLTGVRVLDLTSSLAGPYCTQILSALGADVVKVEHPARGDEARARGPAFATGGSAMFFVANAGKRSLLTSPRRLDETPSCGWRSARPCSSRASDRARRSGSASARPIYAPATTG
jgi:CoA-transferase family III